ncbi:MAG: hypothetical protein RR620_08725 [Clostridium sp.]
MEQITVLYTNNKAKAGQLKKANFTSEADRDLFLDVFKNDITIIAM